MEGTTLQESLDEDAVGFRAHCFLSWRVMEKLQGRRLVHDQCPAKTLEHGEGDTITK